LDGVDGEVEGVVQGFGLALAIDVGEINAAVIAKPKGDMEGLSVIAPGPAGLALTELALFPGLLILGAFMGTHLEVHARGARIAIETPETPLHEDRLWHEGDMQGSAEHEMRPIQDQDGDRTKDHQATGGNHVSEDDRLGRRASIACDIGVSEIGIGIEMRGLPGEMGSVQDTCKK